MVKSKTYQELVEEGRRKKHAPAPKREKMAEICRKMLLL